MKSFNIAFEVQTGKLHKLFLINILHQEYNF